MLYSPIIEHSHYLRVSCRFQLDSGYFTEICKKNRPPLERRGFVMVIAEQLPTMDLNPLSDFKFDKTRERWTLVEDTPLEESTRLSLTGFFEEDEQYVLGETMLERGKNMTEQLGIRLAGQLHAEAMYYRDEKIPAKWRPFDLVFAGTVWQDSYGWRWVVSLYWSEDQWVLRFSWLAGAFWHGRVRLVRVSQVS